MMRFVHKEAHSGFTLIEMLVYLSLLILISVVGVTTILSFNEVLSELRLKRMVTDTANVALERVVRESLSASSVNTGGSTLDGRFGVLALTTPDDPLIFSLSGGVLELIDGSNPPITLTDSEVTVTGFWVHHYLAGETEFIRVRIAVTASAGDMTVAETFYSGVVLRGSYD